jgi:PmbA protein
MLECTEDMFEVLNKAKQLVNNVEIYRERGKEFPVVFKANNFYTAQRKDFDGIGIRVIHKGKMGFANTTKIEACGAVIEDAKNASEFGEVARFEFPSRVKVKNIPIFSKGIRKIENEAIKERIRQFIKSITDADSDAKVDIEYTRGEREISLVNSSGLDVRYDESYVSISTSIFLVIEDSMTWITSRKISPRRISISKKETRELKRKVKLSKRTVPLESGEMSVVIMPSVMVNLLRSFSQGANGSLLQKGASPLKGKEGKKLIDKRVTMYDDAIKDWGVGSRPFDDEGIKTGKIPIFKKGVFKNFLFDLQTAGMLDRKSTGSAMRGYDSTPSPGISNFIVSPGKWTVAEMIKDIKKGIIVHSIIGGGQSNILAGDFSGNVSLGFRIHNGKITGRVKNTMIAGNAYEAMNNIEGIGKNVKNYGNFYTPAFYFKSLNVVSR